MLNKLKSLSNMTKEEIKGLIAKGIAGQGTNVDGGGVLPKILDAIVDALPESGVPKITVLEATYFPDENIYDVVGGITAVTRAFENSDFVFVKDSAEGLTSAVLYWQPSGDAFLALAPNKTVAVVGEV